MIRINCFSGVVFGLIIGGCGGRVPEEAGPPPAAEPRDREAQQIAVDAPPEVRSDRPPERFAPRQHEPRRRYTEVAPPDLHRLPRLKLRMRSCFSGDRESPSRIAAPAPKPRPAVRQRRVPLKARSAGTGAAAGSGAIAEELEAAPAESASRAGERAAEGKSAVAGPEMAADRGAAQIAAAPAPSKTPADPNGGYRDWGAAVYLSNDDTMSLSSAQRVIYAIDNFLPLPAAHIRPHELLNYFAFDAAPVAEGSDFSVLGDMAADPQEPGLYNLSLSIRGRPVDTHSRRNAALTLIVDRSGSMADEGRMDYLKKGLRRMLDELKTGDVLNIVLFDNEVCVPAEGFVAGRDDMRQIQEVIEAIAPRGATDLHSGLTAGYELADRSYRDTYSNRVVVITDALTNTGVTDERMISMISKYYDSRRIRLSGVGVGREFNDALLDRLTERGKGAYVFLGSEAEVEAVFGSRFISLIETTALDVHFRLHLPSSLRMNVFYGEESATVKSDVQAIHYFANTGQLFYSDLMARGGAVRPDDGIMLTIEYKDPESEQPLVEEAAFRIGDLLGASRNVRKARLVMTFIDLLAEMADRPLPGGHGRIAGSWQDAAGYARCASGRERLTQLADGVADDPEVRRLQALFEKFCARFERPRYPVKREIAAPVEGWPGAGGDR